jgi:hypothetical protein
MARYCLVLVFLVACARGSGESESVAAPNNTTPSPPAPTPLTPDAGPPDAGPPDAGPPDAGPPPPDPHKIGGLGVGPFSTAKLTIYGEGQGLREAPVSASVDEGENLWVVTNEALYLLAPGEKTFRRYTAADGLHYGPGWTEPPDITWVEGGGKGECFVGYWFLDTNSGNTPGAHTTLDHFAHLV